MGAGRGPRFQSPEQARNREAGIGSDHRFPTRCGDVLALTASCIREVRRLPS